MHKNIKTLVNLCIMSS
uniref:Uncharacterized protein n=1 Tax=Anguilla anguilla TaxID=7936 RepID=A0A0E9T8D1_ANGAN